jgi:hypothetical protein
MFRLAGLVDHPLFGFLIHQQDLELTHFIHESSISIQVVFCRR